MLPINRKRAIAASVVAAMVLGVVPLFNNAATATASAEAERLAGDDRYETAALIAQDSFPAGATNAIIAYGLNFPDALAASYLAGFVDGPILLTDTDDVPDFTTQALDDLAVDTCYIVGGFQVVGAEAQSELEGHCDTTRIFGGTRYETAQEIATSPPAANVGTLGTKGRTAFVATGEKFADALAAGPIAAAEDFPVILTRPESLSPEASEALDDLEIDHVLLPGGTAAVSAAVQAAIEAKDITVQRFSGADRQHTAVLLAEFGAEELGDDLDHVNVAAGADSSGGADALALAPHGAKESPTLLCENSVSCGEITLGFVEEHASTIASIHIAGGFVRISRNAEDEMVEAAQSTGEAPTITKAEAVDATTVKLTMSEPVEASGGGDLDPSQFTYDKDGSGSGAGVAATSATISADGRTITLKFPASTVDPAAAGDEIVYSDDAAAVDAGDVVDADGNPMEDQRKTVADAPPAAEPMTMKSAVATSANEIVVTLSRAAATSGALDPAQFIYHLGPEQDPASNFPAEAAVLSADGLNISLRFSADVQPDNPLDSLTYEPDTNGQGDVKDSSGEPMPADAVNVSKAAPPTISSAQGTSDSQVVVELSEAVRPYGTTTLSPGQFEYDVDGAGPTRGTPADNAVLTDGKTLILSFPPNTVQSRPGGTNPSGDVLRYSDADASAEGGDLVASDDASPMSNNESELVTATPADPPRMTDATAVDDDEITVIFNEAVNAFDDDDDPRDNAKPGVAAGQFTYDADGPGTSSSPVAATSAGFKDDGSLTLTFPARTVSINSASDTLTYTDTDSAADDGDIVDASAGDGGTGDTAGVQMQNQTIAVSNSIAPAIIDAQAVDDDTVVLSISESLKPGTQLDKTKFEYDADGVDGTPAATANSAVITSPTTIELTFSSPTVLPDAPNDKVKYLGGSGAVADDNGAALLGPDQQSVRKFAAA